MIPSLTPDYVTRCLRERGGLGRGSVTAVIPGSADDGFIRFTVMYDGKSPPDLPAALLVKLNAKGGGYGASEAILYDRIAPGIDVPFTPPTYDVGYDDASGHCYVLQADLSGSHAEAVTEARPPTIETLGGIVDGVARVHAACWGAGAIVDEPTFVQARGDIVSMAQASPLADLREICGRLRSDRLPRLFKIAGAELEPEWQALCAGAIDAWPDLLAARIDGGPLTLMHGDLHPWNVFVPLDGDGPPLIFDWELLVRGIGAYDVSYLILRCRLDPETRRTFETSLLQRYHRQLVDHGVSDYTLDDCREDYRLSILANIAPPLVWGRTRNLSTTIEAYHDWDCGALL